METKRIKLTSIELIRFLAAVAIAMFHFGSFYLKVEKFFPLSYIFVEFFFIVSGFFMMKHICEKKDCMEPIPAFCIYAVVVVIYSLVLNWLDVKLIRKKA